MPGYSCHVRKGSPIRLSRKNHERRCKFNGGAVIAYVGHGGVTPGRAPFRVFSLSLVEDQRGRAGTHPTSGNFILRGKSLIHNGTRRNPQVVGRVHVSVLDGADDKVLTISCVHELRIGFLSESVKELNHLQEPVQGLT